MIRLVWLLVPLTTVGVFALQGRPSSSRPPFTVVESSIRELRTAMEQGRTTSRQIVSEYLLRIARYDRRLGATLAVNARALDEADVLDRERAAGRVRGPLHGIPIALKDNIHTTDMPTTGGALVFDGYTPPYEATLTANLRGAGAIVIAKTGMTELANWVAGPPTPMPNNYNAIRRFGFNPYDPRPDPRPGADGRPALDTGGSSSAIGTAANLWAGNVGTETSGSILSPANQTMLAAIKPTVGRISRHGVIPITADQDTPGPMAKYVEDAAILLGVLEGAAPDPNDGATRLCQPPPGQDYTRALRPSGMKGARIGVPRAAYFERAGDGAASRAGIPTETARLMDEAIATLRQNGAIVIDPANIPSVVDANPNENQMLWSICTGAGSGRGQDERCSVVFKYGMKRDFNRWLASLGPSAPVRTLTELRQWNLSHREAGAMRYGQSNLDISDEMEVERDRARYEGDRAKDVRLAATRGLDAVMKAERLDAVLFPGASGYPTVIVPFGTVANTAVPPFPGGFDAAPQPFGVSFTGLACSEPRLLEIAYAFEQATKRRRPAVSTP
jgi:amidase